MLFSVYWPLPKGNVDVFYIYFKLRVLSDSGIYLIDSIIIILLCFLRNHLIIIELFVHTLHFLSPANSNAIQRL